MSNPITLDEVERFAVNYVQTLADDAAGVQDTLEKTTTDAGHALAEIVSDAISTWGSSYELDPSTLWGNLTAETQADLFDYVITEVGHPDAFELADEYYSDVIYNSDIREVFWRWEGQCEDILDECGRDDRTIMDQMSLAVNIFGHRCLAELLQTVADEYDADDCRDFIQNAMKEGN